MPLSVSVITKIEKNYVLMVKSYSQSAVNGENPITVYSTIPMAGIEQQPAELGQQQQSTDPSKKIWCVVRPLGASLLELQTSCSAGVDRRRLLPLEVCFLFFIYFDVCV